MAELNIDDVLLLIHGEIATAVNSAEIYGHSPGIKLSNIRVRMGQESSQEVDSSDSSISLNTQRFPPAQDGWLIDVSYNPSEQEAQEQKVIQDEILPSHVSSFFAKASVDNISSVGPKYRQYLTKLNIKTIQDLAEFEPDDLYVEHPSLSNSQLRGFQSLARLALSIPEASIPESLLTINFGQLVDMIWKKANDSRLSNIPQQTLDRISRWLQQLEVCLDNNYFNDLTLKTVIAQK